MNTTNLFKIALKAIASNKLRSFLTALGIIIGVILGQIFPESVMKVVVTLQYIMGQLITFCVPLIIIGFIAPSITKLGKNASRLLGVAIVIAYVSSVCAALMSTTADQPPRCRWTGAG